jgi:hypothetical protein
MDEDGNVPERLGLPNSFAEPDDPVEDNPFPPEHSAHRVWWEATRQAQGEIHRINIEAFGSLIPENADEWMPTLIVAKFDVWAKRGVQVVWTDDAERRYAVWLVDYANAWIESVSRYFLSHRPPSAPATILADLRRRLGARVHHWRAEALRYRVQQEAHAAAATPVQPKPSAELIKRRRDAVWKHRDAHGHNAIGFARRLGISDTVIRAIIREDRKRFTRARQEKLLAVIGMTREEWYRE